LTNSGKTLITGSDIYGNEAENVDYALSVVDIATFGCGNFMKLPKTVKTANTVVSKSATGGTIYRTSSTEFNKKDEKKYDNPQYGLSKSQSFVVYSMLKISDVTDSGRQ